jgi:7-carboxy-7-deazaguanine synthase
MKDHTALISEIFPSISGEGISQGYKTVFVRFVGCNLNCVWCDTNYAKKGGESLFIDTVVKQIQKFEPIRHVFFTGGEPMLHDQFMTVVIDALAALGYFFTIKTNGSLPIASLMSIQPPNVSFAMDVKTPSSGMENRMCYENFMVLRETDELLYACANERDFQYAIDHHRLILTRYNCLARPCFSPVWSNEEEMPRVGQAWWQEMAKLFMEQGPHNGKYSLQLHKCIYGVRRRGV